jgi:hypothetical protein
MPTIMDLAGIALPEGKTLDGESLAGFFYRKKKEGKEGALMLDARRWGFAKAIRTKDFKFVMDENKYLYDLKNGREEANVLESNRKIASSLEKRIEEKLGREEKEWQDFVKGLKPHLTFTQKIVNSHEGEDITHLSGWEVKEEYIKYKSRGIDAKPLNIKIRVPNSAYRIYLEGKFGKKKFFSFKKDLFKARAENDRDYKTYSLDDLIDKNLLFLGEHRVSDGFFDLTLDDLEESPGFRIKSLVFEPLKGIKEHQDKERIERLKALGYLN